MHVTTIPDARTDSIQTHQSNAQKKEKLTVSIEIGDLRIAAKTQRFGAEAAKGVSGLKRSVNAAAQFDALQGCEHRCLSTNSHALAN